MIPETSHTPPTHPLPWLESFVIGDDHVDAEHRALMEAANDLCALTLETDDVALLRGQARELIALTEAHFASEEALFPTMGFTGMLSHLRDHVAVRDNLTTLLLSDAPTPAPVAAATARLLLIEHLLRFDLGFKTWVQAARGH